MTPWDVQGSVSEDGKQLAIDYDKLVDQFGTKRIDQALLDRYEWDVPVVLVDGRQVGFHRIDPGRLARAIDARAAADA